MEATMAIPLIDVISATYNQKTDPLEIQNVNSNRIQQTMTMLPSSNLILKPAMRYKIKLARKPNRNSGRLLNYFIVKTDTTHPNVPVNYKNVEARVGDINNGFPGVSYWILFKI